MEVPLIGLQLRRSSLDSARGESLVLLLSGCLLATLGRWLAR